MFTQILYLVLTPIIGVISLLNSFVVDFGFGTTFLEIVVVIIIVGVLFSFLRGGSND